MTEGTNTALLVQLLDQVGGIRQDIGNIKSQLDHGAKRFVSIGDQIDDLEKRQAATETFLGKKLGPIVAVSSAVVAAALWLIALSIGAAFAWAKANLSDHLHWSEWHVSVYAYICAFIPSHRGERQSPPSAPPRTPPVVRNLYDEADGDL